ncbi:carbon-nitrogen family hydrolase [Clostridium sp. BL-8]|uniref:carbon-nitrogen family hydrolase n=1 Tax=Clostridium sp. BL-8 TaxID=349938 RepID=UPI00098C0552|nr:carbon-nitrogen family hydrolase [Clostridium sp. BL-8]OOM76147.1 2-oxoglutaramate amidase [Clostridium sp. BL-8]
MIIGLAQMDISWEDIERNMKKVEEFIEKAAENNVELILFPEMTLTGFTMDIDKLLLSEEEIIDWIKGIAVGNKINIGLGFAIRVDERGKNKYIIISKEGQVLLKYTKLHPFSYAGESEKYYKGEEIGICKIDEFNIASFICYDLRFPEIFQIVSKKAQMITVAANWPKSRQEHWITLLKARAIENQCYVIGINRVGIGDGLQYDGGSVFINPNGEILNEITSKEVLVVEELEIEQVLEVRAKFDIKRDRRENFYSENINYCIK